MERWAELRREHFVRGVGIKELARRYGIDRNTVRRAIRSQEPPRYQRRGAASKLDRFKDERAPAVTVVIADPRAAQSGSGDAGGPDP